VSWQLKPSGLPKSPQMDDWSGNLLSQQSVDHFHLVTEQEMLYLISPIWRWVRHVDMAAINVDI
jgi:hypothetical protein